MSIISTIFSREVEMYKFLHNGKEYFFTSGDKEVTFQNRIYIPHTLKRSNIISSTDDKQILNIMADKDNPIVELFKSLTPSEIKLTIYRASRNDLLVYNQIFNGVVKSCAIKRNEATIMSQAYGSLLTREISIPSYQSECGHEVYNENCGLDEADYSIISQIVSINPNGIDIEVSSVNGNIDQYYQNGILRTNDNKARMILFQEGNLIRIQSPFEVEPSVGDNLTLVAGCNYTSNICKNRFNNFANFRGFEYIPSRNPLTNGF